MIETPSDFRPLLTSQQFLILNYARVGLSTPAISRKLFISVETIKTHLNHAYKALGANSRPNGVDRAWRLGIFNRHTLHPDTPVKVTSDPHYSGKHSYACELSERCPCRTDADGLRHKHIAPCLAAHSCPCRIKTDGLRR